MSTTHFTPAFYSNPFIGAIPADTADNLLYGFAMLRKLNCENWEHDEAMGLYRMFEAMHGAAHHLRLALPTQDMPNTVEVAYAKASGCSPEAIRQMALNELADSLKRGEPDATEAVAHLKAVAERMGCTVEEAAHYATERGLKENCSPRREKGRETHSLSA